MLEKIGTPAFRRFLVDICPWKALHEARDIVDIMHETSLEIYAEKKQALADGDEALSAKVGQGKDIMSILSKLDFLLKLAVYTDIESPKLSASEHVCIQRGQPHRKRAHWSDEVCRYVFKCDKHS